MNRPLRSTFAALLLLLIGTQVASGCVAVAAGAAGAAGYAWYSGSFEASVNGTPKEIANASKKALADLDMHQVKSDATEIDGKVTGRSALDKEVVITIKHKGEGTCAVSIRVGTWGDEALSRDIYEKILKHL